MRGGPSNWRLSWRAAGRQPGAGRRLAVEALENRALLAVLPTGFTEAPVAEGISEGTAMEFAPNGDLWVLEQDGLVKRFRSGSTTADVVGNIGNLGLSSSGERGLLGIAFDPQYATSKRVYLYYTATLPVIHNRISHFTVNDANLADYYFAGAEASGADFGATGQPTATAIFDLDNLSATNHNGGAIHFGPDGKLYVAVGENAVPSYSQSLANVLGKILRMNPDGSAPADNPFFSETTDQEQTIWALGLRNPYTFAFQPGTGRMFINDVGQQASEEINDGIARANYGWPGIEGNDINGTPPTSPGTYVGPIYAYSHGGGTFEGFAITGGAFYNPAVSQFPSEFTGDYFFADYVMSWINVLDVTSGSVSRFASNAPGTVDLRVAGDGSLYYLARNSGQVLRVSFPASEAPTISPIADQIIERNTSAHVDFAIADSQTPAVNLSVSVSSDDSALFPQGSLVLGGTGSSRTLDLTPASNQTGTANITVSVSDGNLTTETSFQVTVTQYPWHNPANGLDVNGDEAVSPDDALEVINEINATGSRLLGPPGETSPPPYLDTSADNYVSPIDALLVINHINATSGNPEGEGMFGVAPTDGSLDILAALIATDIAEQASRRRRLA